MPSGTADGVILGKQNGGLLVLLDWVCLIRCFVFDWLSGIGCAVRWFAVVVVLQVWAFCV